MWQGSRAMVWETRGGCGLRLKEREGEEVKRW